MTNVWGLGNETSSAADIVNINNRLSSKVNKNEMKCTEIFK